MHGMCDFTGQWAHDVATMLLWRRTFVITSSPIIFEESATSLQRRRLEKKLQINFDGYAIMTVAVTLQIGQDDENILTNMQHQ